MKLGQRGNFPPLSIGTYSFECCPSEGQKRATWATFYGFLPFLRQLLPFCPKVVRVLGNRVSLVAYSFDGNYCPFAPISHFTQLLAI